MHRDPINAIQGRHARHGLLSCTHHTGRVCDMFLRQLVGTANVCPAPLSRLLAGFRAFGNEGPLKPPAAAWGAGGIRPVMTSVAPLRCPLPAPPAVAKQANQTCNEKQ